MSTRLLAAAFVMALALSAQALAEDWKQTLDKRLPELGHRNWVVIADSAYPKQSSPGIETIYTGGKQLDVLKHVVRKVEAAKHVRPVIMLDAELEFVPEGSAPGVEAYRDGLATVLGKRSLKVLPHEDIIDKLDEASKLFDILILKTDMTIPYTSVFIELDCGYWGAEEEAAHRQAIEAAQQRQPAAQEGD